MLWLTPVINLLYAVALLALFWLASRAPGRWVGVVYLVVGLVLLVYPTLRITTLANLPLAIRNRLPYDVLFFDPKRGLSLPGAFITAAGLWALFRPRSRAAKG